MAYRARKDADGTFSIFGVPVFAEVPKGEKDAPFKIGKAWLQKALDNSRLRAREGYQAPLHYQHHDGDGPKQKAGHYILTKVRKLSVGGVRKWAVLADFSKLDEFGFASLMSGDWPYRSVEIASYEDAEIESIALLSDFTPFHKFELLNGESIRLDSADMPADLVSAAPVAFSGSSPRYLFRFTDDSTAPKAQPGGGMKHFTILRADDGELALTDSEGSVQPLVIDTSIKFKGQGDDDKLPEDKEKLKKLARAVAAKLATFEDDDEKDDDEKDKDEKDKGFDSDDEKDEDNPHKPAEAKAAKRMQADLITICARMDSMEGQQKSDRKAKRQGDRLEAACAGLRKDSYFVSKSTEEQFAKLAHDSDALDAAVKLYRKVASKDGPDNLDDDNVNDETVGQFASQGEHAHHAAVEADKNYSNSVEAGRRSGDPKERKEFINRHMTSLGYKAAG